MDLLIILTYAGLCIAIFKIFKIPKNKWTLTTAVLGGIALIGGLMLLMNYNHAYANHGREVFVSVPIIAEVPGQVISVEVENDSRVQQGDVLFRLDPVPFELAVVRARAELVSGGQDVLGKEERWNAARARVKRARAEQVRARKEYERFASDPEAFSEMDVENRRQAALAAEAEQESAEAEEKRARLDLEAEVGGEDPDVARRRAELRLAEYQLEQSVVRAPADGIVTQLALRPGSAVRTLPLRPAMVFIPIDRRRFAASFWQNSLRRLEPGYEAEVILDAVPGHVFKGTVSSILPAMSEGEVQSQGALVSAEMLSQPGRAIAVIELEEDLDDYGLPLGVQGQAAIYSEHFHMVAIIRRILIRMMAWMKYVYPIK